MALLVLDEARQLYYENIAGDPRKPVLVFLHEGLGCTAMWKDFPARLCARTGCAGLVYDREGYGLSSPLRRDRSIHYLHEYAMDELPQVLKQLLDARPYIVIGHSDGGSIALIHAAGKPAGLLGVVTEAAHVFVEDVTLDGIRVARQAWDAGKLRGLERYHGAKSAQIFDAWADTWLRPEFAYWNIEYLLAAIDCPLLALQGSGDQYGSEAQLDAIVARVACARKHVVPECGHTPHQEKPDVLLAALDEFIKPLEET